MSVPRYEHGAMGTGSNHEPMDLGYVSNVKNDDPRRKCVRIRREKKATASDFWQSG